MALGACLRLWSLGWPNHPYADEAFYVLDGAESYLQAVEDENRAHPPLGKLLIAASIVASGSIGLQGAGAWRWGSVVAGLCGVLLVFVLGREMAGDWRIGALAAFLVATSLLHITQSRIATLDIYLSLFVTAGVAASWMLLEAPPERELPWILAASTAFALAVAVKLSGLLGALGALTAVIILKRSARLVFRALAVGMALTVFVSCLCYLPLLRVYEGDLSRTAERVWDNHLMVWSHRAQGLHHHPELSPWWKWPLLLRPTWYLRHTVPETRPTQVRVVVAFGSPILWWGFLAALPFAVFRPPDPRSGKAVRFCLIVYAAQTVGWLAIPGFFYYMLVNLPLMALVLALVMPSWPRWLAGGFLVGICVCLWLYWPLAVGYPIPLSLLYDRLWLGAPWL